MQSYNHSQGELYKQLETNILYHLGNAIVSNATIALPKWLRIIKVLVPNSCDTMTSIGSENYNRWSFTIRIVWGRIGRKHHRYEPMFSTSTHGQSSDTKNMNWLEPKTCPFLKKNIVCVSVLRVYLRQSVLYSLFLKILNMQFSHFKKSVCVSFTNLRPGDICITSRHISKKEDN